MANKLVTLDGLEAFKEQSDTTYASKTVASQSAAGLMSASDKTKLDGIATGAEVNVQSDWNATSGDAFIKNKPTIPTKSSWNYDDSYVKYSETQSLTTLQQAKARLNIGAGTSSFSGSYNDLTNKPTIPTVPTSLKNPSAVTIKAGTETVSSYDGSAAKTFTIAASSTAGAFTISDGSTTKTVQLAGKFTDNNTTYESKTAAFGGTAVSLVTTGEKYAWNNKASTLAATTSAAGLMSAADKAKLDGIATGATKNTFTYNSSTKTLTIS